MAIPLALATWSILGAAAPSTPPIVPVDSVRRLCERIASELAPASGRVGRLQVLRYNPRDRTIAVYDCHAGRIIETHRGGDEIRLPSNRAIAVAVHPGNTALYSYAAAATPVAAPEAGALRGFLAGIAPYLTDVLSTTSAPFGFDRGNRGGLPPNIQRDTAALRNGVARLNAAVTGWNEAARGRSLDQLRLRATAAFQRLAHDSIESVAQGLIADLTPHDIVPCTSDSITGSRCRVRLTVLDSLASLYDAIGAARQRLQQDLAACDTLCKGSAENLTSLIETATKAMTDMPKVTASAWQLQRFIDLIVNASDLWTGTPFTISQDTGRSVKLGVTPRKLDDSPVVVTDSTTVELRVLPAWILRPAVGVSLILSPASTFDRFTTRKNADSTTYGIVSDSVQDGRFTWGLMLSLVPAAVRNASLDVTINPSGDLKAFAIGAGVTLWSSVHLGAGWLFTRHVRLSGVTATSTLAGPDELRTRDTYAPGQFYFSFSVVGWPPFVKTGQ